MNHKRFALVVAFVVGAIILGGGGGALIGITVPYPADLFLSLLWGAMVGYGAMMVGYELWEASK